MGLISTMPLTRTLKIHYLLNWLARPNLRSIFFYSEQKVLVSAPGFLNAIKNFVGKAILRVYQIEVGQAKCLTTAITFFHSSLRGRKERVFDPS